MSAMPEDAADCPGDWEDIVVPFVMLPTDPLSACNDPGRR